MSEPSVPGGRGAVMDLPCGEEKRVRTLDLGRREFDCPCGSAHAVVMDVHPADRFLPEFLLDVLREAIETTSDDMPEFGTAHLMGLVLEEFPQSVVSEDVSDDGEIGAGIVWVTDFDSRRLHEIIVELVVELMEHAVSHADDEVAVTEFERQMLEFDVSEFVETYRAQRDIDPEPYM